MKKSSKAFAALLCTAAVLLNGVTVFAAEDKYTPSGLSYGEIGSTIGNMIGGKFGKKLGGNLGAQLGRNLLGTFAGKSVNRETK